LIAGGSNEKYNLWLLCNPCDKKKGRKIIQPVIDSTIENRLAYLKKKIHGK